jgi:CheY-like chemotaxis protein
MALHDFDRARAIHEALIVVFARELGGTARPEVYALVCKLCDGAVDAVNDVDCRVAIRGVKSSAALLYSDGGAEGIETGPLQGADALRFQILNALTNFRGRLDVLQNRPPSRPEMPAIEAQKYLRILVVEDNRDSAESLRKLLEICGYAVTVAYTAAEGLEEAKRTRPDVVLCDIGLPDSNGFELACALRAEPETASARLIAVTAYGTDIDRARSEKAGFNLHLVKPVNPAELLDQLGRKQQAARSVLGLLAMRPLMSKA